MSKEQNLVSTEHFDCNHFDGDLYANTQLRERALNAAIAGAEISESFEEYLAIFDAFYADDIEVSSETANDPIRGKDNILTPLLLIFPTGRTWLPRPRWRIAPASRAIRQLRS